MRLEFFGIAGIIVGLCFISAKLCAFPHEEVEKDGLIDVYMIPGMGTDYRVYRDFNLNYGNIKYIQWADPGNIRTLEEYAALLKNQIDTSRKYIIVGTSFGGMIGVELSQKLNNPNLILISSAKTKKELPNKYKGGQDPSAAPDGE